MRPNQPLNVDEVVYYDISIQDEDGVALDADSNPTVEYRIDGSDTLSSSGITVAKVAATTGLYEVTVDLSTNASIVADSNLRFEETATISSVDYINRWSVRVRQEISVDANGTAEANVVSADNGSLDSTAIEDVIAQVVADAVWDEATSGHTSIGTFGAVVEANSLAEGTIESIADYVWDETQATHTTVGSFGEIATELAAVKAITDQMVFTVANQIDANALSSVGDATLANQTTIISGITPIISIPTSQPDTSTLNLVRGDAYDGTANNVLTWTASKDVDGETVNFTIRDMADNIVLDQDTTGVTTLASTTTVTVDLSSAATELLTEAGQYKFDVEIEFSSTSRWTIAAGLVDVKEDQSR